MISSAPKDRQNVQEDDPEVLPEETVEALIKLALLLRDIRARQAAERPFTDPNTQHHDEHHQTGGKKPTP